MTHCVLAIDLGTGGPKVALVHPSGATLAWRSAPVATRFLPDGGAEQDPHEMWAAVVSATHDVLAAVAPLPPIVAVAVTSQYMSTIPVAADGTPTGPCVLWMDTRGAAHNLGLLTDESFMLFLERHGMIPLPSGNDNVAHAHVLQQFHPEAYSAAAALVEPMDYLTARLTGRITATQSTVFGQLVCDNRTWGATEYDPELVAATQLDPAKLAPLVPMNSVVGELRPGVAAQLGLAAGLPVVAGTIDSITSAVGSGALDATGGSILIGTTAVMVSHISEQRNDITAGVLAVPSPLPGKYYVLAENGLGGRALEWAQRLFGYASVDDALADAATVGSEGVQFLPWLLGSIAPSPNDDVRGAFVGLSLQHDRRHALRATLEGVALNLAWLLPAVESFVGAPFPFLRFGGGGAQSPLWAQLLADALDRPVHRLAEPRATNARGAAFLAFDALGMLDLTTVPSLLHTAEVHQPDPAQHAAMQRSLARMIALHPSLALS
ncbi:MAG: FGGY family carbohydrate kinase [Actinomycetota bacterium]|nr:FGGY family carbohydrate kinase [Actinomycetota bacterium]